MRKLTRPEVEQLVPYTPGKPIEELERELGIKDSIKLASNENPLGPSPMAVKAIEQYARMVHRYPDGNAYYLKAELSKRLQLSEKQIIIGNGSNELIELAVRTFLLPGEHAIQAAPTFLMYEKVVAGAGGKMVSVPLSDLRADLKAISKAIRPETKIIFINNPNNPTGTALLKNEMTSFLRAIPQDLVIVLDEAYIEFASDPALARGESLLEYYPRVVVLRTFSKLYGLAGLRVGYGFGSEQVIDYMNRVRQPFNVGSIAQAAARAALMDTEFVSKTLKTVRGGLSYLYHELELLGLEFVPTQTNFFLIKVPIGGRKAYELLLREGVIVRSMEAYDLHEYIRVNVGLPEENERFIGSLRKILSSGIHSKK